MLKNVALGRYVYDPKRFKTGQNNFKTYEGYSEETGQLVNIKLVRMRADSCYGCKNVDEDSRRQLQAFSKFKHSHFVQAVEIAETQNHIYIVWERYKENLQNRMNTYRRPENSFKIFLDLVIALCVLRSKRYYHTNFVASSIEISEQNIKVSDMTACVHQNQMLRVGKPRVVNNWRQIAPEILRQSYLTEKSMIWNVGAILHRLLFQKYPYESMNKEDMITISKVRQMKLELKADPYLSRLLQGCLEINPRFRFNLKDLLKTVLCNPQIPQPYEEIILNKISLLKQPLETLGCSELLQKYFMMKEAENEINYIRILQRTCYLAKRIERDTMRPPLIFLTKFIIQCRLERLHKLPYWDVDRINSKLLKQKEQVTNNELKLNTNHPQKPPEDTEKYGTFLRKEYSYKQIIYLQYQAFLRQFILENVKYLQRIRPQALCGYRYQIYAVDFAISLFSLGQDLITDSSRHKWKFFGSYLSKIAEDPLESDPVQIMKQNVQRIKDLDITD